MVSTDPFASIALTMSGGGFRAAAFALGTVTFLNELLWKECSLLSHVKAISTVSGGTITGIAYAVSISKGEDFTTFFRKSYNLLQSDSVLNEALRILEDDDNLIWNSTHKRRTLINAFSLAYSKMLTDEKFGLFCKETIGHLDEVVFNATEFTFAQPFRFQTRGWLGNKKLNEYDATLGRLKEQLLLSDILAASSCFPVGFEPIIFPHDFMPNSTEVFKALITDPRYSEGIGLMDGGIVDNQGIASIQLSQERR